MHRVRNKWMDRGTNTINRARVLRAIGLNRGISRVDVATRLGLDKSTVTLIVNQLMHLGILIEIDDGKTMLRRGRRPVSLAINKEYGAVLGLELQARAYRAVALNLAGQVIHSEQGAMDLTDGQLVEGFCDITTGLLETLKGMGIPVLGVGVGISGVVNFHEGVVYHSIPLNIHEPLAFTEQVGWDLDVPVFIENDANCIAWGELAFHKPLLLNDIMCVLLQQWNRDQTPDYSGGLGVGFGVVIGGKVFHGRQYSVGEFRSLNWQEANKGQFSLSDEDLARIGLDDRVFERFARELASHVALFVNMLNLSHVVITGALEGDHGQLITIIQEEIQGNWPYPEPVDCEVLTSALGDDAVAYGAAGMFLERIFEHPEVPLEVEQAKGLNGIDILMQR